MSIIAIDRNSVPENVMAIYITFADLKQLNVEIQFPKIATYKKKVIIKIILIIKTVSILVTNNYKIKIKFEYIKFNFVKFIKVEYVIFLHYR
jgi:hypothetical protein